jgi:hypothetical protein
VTGFAIEIRIDLDTTQNAEQLELMTTMMMETLLQ